MVPDLRRVVKYRRRTGFVFGRSDDLVERHLGELGARNELVKRIDVRSVVLAVMKTDRVRRYHRF
jgi:hypothetical protein